MKISLWLIMILVCLTPLMAEDSKAQIPDPANNTRSYPAPVFETYKSKASQNLKGPIKVAITESLGFPVYFSEDHFDPDGKLTSSSGGRMNLISEAKYWYDEHGNLSRELSEEYANGMESEGLDIISEYQYDSLGYPVKQVKKTSDGAILSVVELLYSDTGYVKEWQTPATEYCGAFSYREGYDLQGRILYYLSTNMEDGSIDKREFSYDDVKHIQTESNLWDGTAYNWVKKTELNPQGGLKAWTISDGSGKILSTTTYSLDSSGNITKEVYRDVVAGTSSQTTYKYKFDRYGNPLSIECRIDGELDEVSSCNMTYEYY